MVSIKFYTYLINNKNNNNKHLQCFLFLFSNYLGTMVIKFIIIKSYNYKSFIISKGLLDKHLDNYYH